MVFPSAPDPTSKQKDETIFLWIDILGFSERLEDVQKYKKLLENLNYYVSLFNESDFYDAEVVSDGIFIKIKENTDIKSVFKEVGEKQIKLILQKEVFVRGGISTGIRPDDKLPLVTNGLSRAVKLESKSVSWPVIATNKEFLEKLREIKNAPENEFFGLTQGFNQYGEEIYFVDFLDYIDKKDLTIYLSLVFQNINENKADFRYKNKYIWLLRQYYHKFGNTNYSELVKELQGVVL
jgi:hypothetical protein